MDIAMIDLMRDARLRVSEAAELTWDDIQRVRGGSGRMRVVGADEADHREVSANTMKLLLPIRRGAEDHEPVLGMRPNQIGRRIDVTSMSCTVTGSWRSFTTSYSGRRGAARVLEIDRRSVAACMDGRGMTIPISHSTRKAQVLIGSGFGLN